MREAYRMKVKFFIPIILLGLYPNVSGPAWAQQEPAEFGVVSMEEMKMQSYPPDPSAPAVILFDKGETRINLSSAKGGFFRRHIRIKIFSKQAYDEWANVKLIAERSSVSKLKGASYSLENGVIVKSELSDDAIFKGRYGKSMDEIGFTFPNLKEGSVIEYSYAIIKSSLYLPSWSFQSTIPTLWSGYAMYVPAELFKSDIRGTIKITDYETKHNDRYRRWIITDVPAFKSEPLMPHQGIYKSTINFWPAFNSWLTFNNRLMDSDAFGNIVTQNTSLQKKVDELTAGIGDPKQKIKVISDYVKQSIHWDGTLDFIADNPKTVFEKKTGSSGDINLILGSLLAKAGLKVNMVLLSTRNHGFVLQEFPSLSQFDYVICLVSLDRDSLMLDATEKYLPYDVLPERCLNYDGFVIDQPGPRWIKINSTTKASTTVNGDLKINENGDLQGKLVFDRGGYDALDARRDYEVKGKDAYIKHFLRDKTWQIEKSEIQNVGEMGKPFTEAYEVVINDVTTRAGALMYINPFVALREETNPFIFDKRVYPIDFGTPAEHIFFCAFTIPEGFVVEELPQSKIIRTQDNAIKCTFSIFQTGNRIFVTNNLQIYKTLFMEDEYPTLRDFYALLVAKMSEQIVLKRKN